MACVWAFQPLSELNNRTGFVECDDETAAELLAQHKVQDPRIGGTALITIGAPAPEPRPKSPEPQEYATKEMTPKRRGK